MPRGGTEKEKYKTRNDVFDLFTEKTLFKLIQQGYFKGIQSPVSIGKESNVFTALRADTTPVIVKIYRLETCDFNQMYLYLRSDPRFPNLRRSRRKIIFTWATREYRNLLKARQANVSVPTPYAVANNVLVLEYIGSSPYLALKLKDSPPRNISAFFNATLENMKRLYRAGMVHADLSAFNILNFNDTPVFIDFSQSTTSINPEFDEYLRRDIKNILLYFHKKGITLTASEVYQHVTS